MSYLSRVNPRRRSGRNAAVYAIAIAVCLIIGFFLRPSIVKFFSYFGGAFDQAIYSILPQGFRSERELALANQSLESQISTLEASLADRNVLANENERLKAGFGRSEKEKVVYASVIKRPPGAPYDTFILDAGSESGIVIGDGVVDGAVLIGSIVEANNGYSIAKLLSSPGNTFDGMLAGNIGIQAKGLGGGSFEALIPLGTVANIGDALILPGVSSRIFGLVQEIEEKPAEGFKRILFSLPINPNQVSSVGVVIR